jgi:hypothetical protein
MLLQSVVILGGLGVFDSFQSRNVLTKSCTITTVHKMAVCHTSHCSSTLTGLQPEKKAYATDVRRRDIHTSRPSFNMEKNNKTNPNSCFFWKKKVQQQPLTFNSSPKKGTVA